jgi:hypothetical protein
MQGTAVLRGIVAVFGKSDLNKVTGKHG